MSIHSMPEFIRKAVEFLDASVKSFLSHAGTGFEGSEFVRIMRIWLCQFWVAVVTVTSISHSDFAIRNFLFQLSLIHWEIRICASWKWSFQPHQLGFKQGQRQLIGEPRAIGFVRIKRWVFRQSGMFWIWKSTMHTIKTNNKTG